mmetsp:Transcript_10004/g.27248  ORF Transcript_10004/g.27248 Transcript_10004/m.27248 type:complete len:211 (+) Transcript_10004:230-862(+)
MYAWGSAKNWPGSCSKALIDSSTDFLPVRVCLSMTIVNTWDPTGSSSAMRCCCPCAALVTWEMCSMRDLPFWTSTRSSSGDRYLTTLPLTILPSGSSKSAWRLSSNFSNSAIRERASRMATAERVSCCCACTSLADALNCGRLRSTEPSSSSRSLVESQMSSLLAKCEGLGTLTLRTCTMISEPGANKRPSSCCSNFCPDIRWSGMRPKL